MERKTCFFTFNKVNFNVKSSSLLKKCFIESKNRVKKLHMLQITILQQEKVYNKSF